MLTKRLLLITMLGFAIFCHTHAQQRKFSPEEWKQQFEAYVTDKADLTKDEATKFFPLYTEMKDKQRSYYKKIGDLLKNSNEENVAEATYAKTNWDLIQLRIASEKIEIEYLKKFRKVLSDKKIFLVKKADFEFQHQALRRMSKHTKDKPSRK